MYIRAHGLVLEADSFLFPRRFALELVTEKGHPFAEELQKVSNSVSSRVGILYPCGLMAITAFAI